MKGSIRKRKKNAWSYRIDLGFVDGKRKQVEKGGFKTEREAVKAMQDALYHLNNTGDYVENKKISFHTVYEEFIEREGKATRAYATLKKYDSLYRNHIKEPFGPLYVYKISDTMIIDFLNLKRQKYSEEYVKGFYKFFNVVLRYAHEHKYTKKNVMDIVPLRLILDMLEISLPIPKKNWRKWCSASRARVPKSHSKSVCRRGYGRARALRLRGQT